MMATTVLPVPTILNILQDNNKNSYMMDQNVEQHSQRAKKRRLDHLSWEEKLQRKKLKNRVAAQTSRDRKKAKQEQMENAIQQLFTKNEALMAECEKLREANERLQTENKELQQRLQGTSGCQCQNRPVVSPPASGSTESFLQPKGTGADTAAALTGGTSKMALLRMVLACLLYRTFSTSSNPNRWSTSTPSNSSRRLSSKISPEIWRALLKRQLIKNQPLIEKIIREKWWGRHQNNWNPVDLTY